MNVQPITSIKPVALPWTRKWSVTVPVLSNEQLTTETPSAKASNLIIRFLHDLNSQLSNETFLASAKNWTVASVPPAWVSSNLQDTNATFSTATLQTTQLGAVNLTPTNLTSLAATSTWPAKTTSPSASIVNAFSIFNVSS